MGRRDKLIERLLSVPSDFTYSELKKIMMGFDYQERMKGATSGSRVSFFHKETKAVISLHKPHPQDIIGRSLLRDVIEFLKEHDHI